MIEALPVYKVARKNGSLVLSIPCQAPMFPAPYRVQVRLRRMDDEPVPEIELYVEQGRRHRLVDVGLWTLGAYVLWEKNRSDFNMFDAVEGMLRRELPGGVGYVPRVKQSLFGGDRQSFDA